MAKKSGNFSGMYDNGDSEEGDKKPDLKYSTTEKNREINGEGKMGKEYLEIVEDVAGSVQGGAKERKYVKDVLNHSPRAKQLYRDMKGMPRGDKSVFLGMKLMILRGGRLALTLI